MDPGSRFKEKRVSGKIGLLLASLALFLFLLEGAFRILGIKGFYKERVLRPREILLPKKELLPNVLVQYKPNMAFRGIYESNPRGYFDEENGIDYRTNRFGLRGEDMTVHKPAGMARILVLGDSFTFGEGVRFNDTFCEKMEKILVQRLGRAVEVINGGVSAWGTKSEISFLEQVGVSFEPDLIVVAYVLNDADYAGDLDLWRNFRERYEKRSLRFSYLLSFVYSAAAKKLSTRKFIQTMVESAERERHKWYTSFHFLKKGKSIAGSLHAGYLVVLFPFLYDLSDTYPFLKLHRLVQEFCEKEGIGFLDLFFAFKGNPYTSLWVHPSDPHPNEKGHQIAAEALADKIIRESLLKNPLNHGTGKR